MTDEMQVALALTLCAALAAALLVLRAASTSLASAGRTATTCCPPCGGGASPVAIRHEPASRRDTDGLLALPAVLLAACAHPVLPADQRTLPAHEVVREDTSHKESPRLVPAEAYLRTYLRIFSGRAGSTALQAQQRLSGNGLFDNWNAYLGALGLPNYPIDLPRKQQTNALMLATFERLGVALCDRAVEHDLKARPALPVPERVVFAFELPQPKAPLDAAGFAERFDRLHRTFLGYPARLALTPRTERFYQLYQDTIFRHIERKSRFTPVEAAWAAVCYGLVRHPEFHLY